MTIALPIRFGLSLCLRSIFCLSNHKILQDKLTKEEWKRYKEEEKRISENVVRFIIESKESQKRDWNEKEMNIKWQQFRYTV